ncbi:hypothetical protein ACWDV4_12720 [Micromonospora sp. NPDC003197]
MDLKPVVMYREMYLDRYQDLPSLWTAETGVTEPDRARVLDYMHSVRAVLDAMGSVPDLFADGEWIQGGSSLYSDGIWVWREDSMKYLAEQPLTLPAEFVGHIRGHDYAPPAFDDTDPAFDAAFLAYF